MKKTVRLVAFSNDGFALAAANFYFPISDWVAISRQTHSTVKERTDTHIRVRLKQIQEVSAINPSETEYATLTQRLGPLPRGHTWKIGALNAIYAPHEEMHTLQWIRDTIHPAHSTEEDYQQFMVKRTNEVWKVARNIFEDTEAQVRLQEFRKSILVLEAVDGDPNIAGNIDFLLNILATLRREGNELSKTMYDVVWRVELRRGTLEYQPYEK